MVLYLSMAKKKSQAQHNEEACHYLNGNKQFPDWVIISAFYSAIHYVDDYLFPNLYEIHGGETKQCATIDDYYQKNKNKGSLKTRHQLRLHLVEDNTPEISSQFKWLMDQSFTMRYSNFDTDQDEADTAIKYLAEIKEFCEENE